MEFFDGIAGEKSGLEGVEVSEIGLPGAGGKVVIEWEPTDDPGIDPLKPRTKLGIQGRAG